jgi:F-box interacting protein
MSDNVNASYDSLPDEIVTQILIHLPIKSIITCTSVSKTWKSIIQNPTFISIHLHLSIKSNNNLNFLTLFTPQNKEVYALHSDDDDDFTEHTRFDFPHKPINSKIIFRVVGICNGLVCISDDLHGNTNQLFLWNPCVRKFVKLPLPNVTCQLGKKHGSIGFGFDAKTNDYKVARVVYLEVDPNILKERPKVEVYSLSTCEWRIITAALPPICTLNLIEGREPQAFVNGAIHWIAFRGTGGVRLGAFVLVFDLGDEVFREIPLPKLPNYNPQECRNDLCAYGNSIALFQTVFVDSRHLDIWVMKEYGVSSSWTKVLTLAAQVRILPRGLPLPPIPRAIGFKRNGKVVLDMGWRMSMGMRTLTSQDLETQEKKDLRITSYYYTFVDSYVESLILLDKVANGAVTY